MKLIVNWKINNIAIYEALFLRVLLLLLLWSTTRVTLRPFFCTGNQPTGRRRPFQSQPPLLRH